MYTFVMERLQDTKGDWPEVAASAGMSYRTISKIARREINDPGYSKIRALANFFGFDNHVLWKEKCRPPQKPRQ